VLRLVYTAIIVIILYDNRKLHESEYFVDGGKRRPQTTYKLFNPLSCNLHGTKCPVMTSKKVNVGTRLQGIPDISNYGHVLATIPEDWCHCKFLLRYCYGKY